MPKLLQLIEQLIIFAFYQDRNDYQQVAASTLWITKLRKLQNRQLDYQFMGIQDHLLKICSGLPSLIFFLNAKGRHANIANYSYGEHCFGPIYSLCHTCIMCRLLYAEGLDLLTLARNARMSPEMSDRFYARHLSAEINIGLLQSKGKRKPVVADADEAEEIPS